MNDRERELKIAVFVFVLSILFLIAHLQGWV